jgi:membrane protease YdiL (CAAX protease family)
MNDLSLPLETDDASSHKLAGKTLLLFFTVTFVFTWLVLGLAALSANHLIALTLPSTLLITIATLGPALGAITAVAFTSGRPGVRGLMTQMGRWRVGGRWYLVALVAPAFVMLASFLLWRVLGGAAVSWPPLATWLSVPVLTLVLLIPALFEELGWRGLALPRLQARYGWLVSSLILGVVWAIWHLPIWFIPEAGFGTLPFPVFMLFTVALSLLFTWLYNGTGGSVLLPALAHAAINAYVLPWNTAVYALPENARGLHLQIPVALVLTVLALLLILLRSSTLKRSLK